MASGTCGLHGVVWCTVCGERSASYFIKFFVCWCLGCRVVGVMSMVCWWYCGCGGVSKNSVAGLWWVGEGVWGAGGV